MVWPNVRRSDLVTEQACETNTSTKCVLTHFSEFYGGGGGATPLVGPCVCFWYNMFRIPLTMLVTTARAVCLVIHICRASCSVSVPTPVCSEPCHVAIVTSTVCCATLLQQRNHAALYSCHFDAANLFVCSMCATTG